MSTSKFISTPMITKQILVIEEKDETFEIGFQSDIQKLFRFLLLTLIPFQHIPITLHYFLQVENNFMIKI